jgi:hypothetical protein
MMYKLKDKTSGGSCHLVAELKTMMYKLKGGESASFWAVAESKMMMHELKVN